MSESGVVEYLRTNSVASLERLGVYARWSTVHPEKFTLNYDQIEAVDGDPLVEECRGVVLVQESRERGEPGRYRIIARPFRRFYNLGQPGAAEIDWSTAAFEEKLDGTLCIVYHYGGQWNVATRSMPDADVPSPDRTFAERFWAAADVGVRDLLARGEELTFCFELTAPDNQIVIPYNDTKLTLLGAFDPMTGAELRAPWLCAGVARPEHWRFGGPVEAANWVNSQPGTALEGLVVVDGNGNRVKIKNSQYLAVAAVMSSANTDKGLVSIILSGTADDVRQWLPAPRQERLDQLATGVRVWARTVEWLASEVQGWAKSDRKRAALHIQATDHVGWIGTILDIATGKAPSVSEWLKGRKTPEGTLPPSLVEKIALAAAPVEAPEVVEALDPDEDAAMPVDSVGAP